MMQKFARPEILIENNLLDKLNIFVEITKLRITFLVSLTTALGYILAANQIKISLLFSVIGIFLLACSASALNQFQESEIDKLMLRTKERPIPSGRVSVSFVFNTSMVLLISGSLVLYLFVNSTALMVGLITMLWYNGVYTPLKRKTAFAIIPGSLVGALPPIAGWVSAGGSLYDFNICLIAFYFFIWQIPHFWLLLLLHGKDYQSAGFPVLNNIFTDNQLKKITFVWILLTMLLSVSIAFSGIVNYSFSMILLLLTSVFLLYSSIVFLNSSSERKNVVKMFVKINIHTLLIIILLSSDKLISLIKNF